MKCINFDHQFELYAADWMKKNAEKYKNNMDIIEMMMPDVYMEFLKKPVGSKLGSSLLRLSSQRGEFLIQSSIC